MLCVEVLIGEGKASCRIFAFFRRWGKSLLVGPRHPQGDSRPRFARLFVRWSTKYLIREVTSSRAMRF